MTALAALMISTAPSISFASVPELSLDRLDHTQHAESPVVCPAAFVGEKSAFALYSIYHKKARIDYTVHVPIERYAELRPVKTQLKRKFISKRLLQNACNPT